MSDPAAIVPRLAPAEAVCIAMALGRLARVYEASSAALAPWLAELAARDRVSSASCRELAARLERLRLLMGRRL